MRTAFATALAFVLLSGVAAADSPADGTYQLMPSVQVKEFCSKHNLPLPEGTLVLGKGVFDFVVKSDSGTAQTRGSFATAGDIVAFVVEVGKGAGLPSTMKFSEEELRSDEALFVRERKASLKPSPSPAPVTSVVGAPVVISLPGLWTLHRESGEDKVTRFFFNKNGEFWFKSDSSSSKGTYKTTQEGIELLWTEVDGSPVTFNMRKTLPWTESGVTFKVDTYFYKRAEK